MRVFPVRGKGIGVHAKQIFARRRVIHRSCGERTFRALLASVNNSGGTISLQDQGRAVYQNGTEKAPTEQPEVNDRSASDRPLDRGIVLEGSLSRFGN